MESKVSSRVCHPRLVEGRDLQASCFQTLAALSLLCGFHSQGFLVATDGPRSHSCQTNALGQCYSDHGPGHELFITSLP